MMRNKDKLKDEIERLTKDRNQLALCNKGLQDGINEYQADNAELGRKNAELQKQVDELKKENARLDKNVKWFQEKIENGELVSEQVVKDTAKEILDEYSKMLIEGFIKCADIQDFVTVKTTLRNVCPAKVKKIKKKMAKRYGLWVEQ